MCQDDMSYAYILVRVNSYSFIIKFADWMRMLSHLNSVTMFLISYT